MTRNKWLWVILTGAMVFAAGICLLFFSQNAVPKEVTVKTDIVVIGAGPGGIAASIQAARMGKDVILLEPTDWIGGQMTAAGVGTMDEGGSTDRQGIYKEFVDKTTDYYAKQGKSIGTCYSAITTICVDPQIGQKILKEMLQAESKHLRVITRQTVTRVSRDQNKVTGVKVGNINYDAKVVIDAGEYGDVLSMAGAEFRLGNGTSDAPKDESCIQTITYTAVIKDYPQGVPKKLKFNSPPPGYDQKVANHFANYLAKNGHDLVVSNNKKSATHGSPMSFVAYTSYRGYPDLANPKNYNALQENESFITRTSLNLANDYPFPGQLSAKFVSDLKYRAQAICAAKLATLQLVYYIQHDLGEINWSIADDEGYDTDYNKQNHCASLDGYQDFEQHMSQEPYVREARRIVGEATLTGNELQYSWKDKTKIPHYKDSVAIGSYPMDLHKCNTKDSLETQLDDINQYNSKGKGGRFEVPMGVLIPKKIDGLLAAEKNISVSRLAEGAIREQPIAMATGQAAGALAAISVEQNKQPREVNAVDVQKALKSAGQQTSLP